MNEREIPPCPFCGAPTYLDTMEFDNSEFYRVRCTEKSAHALDHWEPYEEDAILIWSERYE